MKQTNLLLLLLVVWALPLGGCAQTVRDYDYYYGRGKHLSDNDSFAQAVVMLDSAIKQKPTSSEANEWRGYCELFDRLFVESFKDYDSATFVTVRKTDFALIERMELDLSYYPTSTYFSNAQILKLYNTAIALFPDSSRVYIDRSRYYSRRKNFSGAIADAKKAIAISPIPSNYGHLAYIMTYGVKSYSQREILKVYNECIARNPNTGEGYLIRGEYYERLSKNAIIFLDSNRLDKNKKMIKWYNKAIADYDKAISIEPKTWRYYNIKLDCKNLLHICKPQEILKDYDEWIANVPEKNPGYISRSNYYASVHKYKEAVANLDTVIMTGPANRNYYIQRAIYRCHLGGNNIEELKADLENMGSLDNQKRFGFWTLESYQKIIKAYCDSTITDKRF